MTVLLGIGFLGGVITGISPCILPVLPVIVASGAASQSWRRPVATVAGLVASFSLFTLVGGSLLSLLGLPQDTLRDLGIAALLMLGIGLLVPQVGDLLERPFARLGAHRQSGSGSGFVLGLSLGLVFVPCAGPVLAAISVVSATHRVGLATVLLTLAYALGAAVPLLAFALLGQRTATGWKAMRSRAPLIRRVAGAVLAITAVAIALNVTRPLQTSVPGYASTLENHIEGSAGSTKALQQLTGGRANKFSAGAQDRSGSLPNLGRAPGFTGIDQWLNTPGGRPLSLTGLRGKVVLVDFWTYSCINCQRTLPHVEAWYNTYRADGLVIVGVHTPEFPFEHVVSNVQAAAAQLGVDYPIAIDNDYATWNAYGNEYWPAEYLIDQQGDVRHVQFGEGDYSGTEAAIRTLLAAGGAARLPTATEVANRTPTEATTPETYVGYSRLKNYSGQAIDQDTATSYALPASVAANTFALGGTWTVGADEATAGNGASLVLSFTARNVYLVLGGSGTVTATFDHGPPETTAVSGVPSLYTLLTASHEETGRLVLTMTPGVQAYDFTFG